MVKVGLALQGGGTRGAYQAGAYMALKKCHIKINAVAGTSIGAINGLFIAAHKEKELLNFWQTVNIGKLLNFDDNYLEDKKNSQFDLKHTLKNYGKIVKNRGLDTTGIKDLLKSVSYHDLRKSKIEYGLLTIKLDHLHPKPVYIYKEDIPEKYLYDYVFASCYLPMFKMEKKIDNHYYLDGGFYDNTPINMLIDKKIRKIYVIELKPFININRKIKKQAEIIRITPSKSLGGVITLDNHKLNEYIKLGYYDTLKKVKNLDGYHYCFKKRSELYYHFIMRKVNPKDLNYLKGFFHAKTEKEALLKGLEYLMKYKCFTYYTVYDPLKVINSLKKSAYKKHFIYEIIRQIKFL